MQQYKVMVDKEQTKKLIHYLDTWKWKCNPFWLNALCGYDHVKQQEFKHRKMIEMFIDAYATERKVFLMKEEDMKRGFTEHGWNYNDVAEALKDGILVNKNGFIGLSDKVLDFLY